MRDVNGAGENQKINKNGHDVGGEKNVRRKNKWSEKKVTESS